MAGGTRNQERKEKLIGVKVSKKNKQVRKWVETRGSGHHRRFTITSTVRDEGEAHFLEVHLHGRVSSRPDGSLSKVL